MDAVFPRRITVQRAAPAGDLQSSMASKLEPCDNTIRTSRYTLLTFLPMNLFEQFMHPANFFFLVVGVLQSLRAVSTTEGVPTIAVPLTIVLFVSGIRAAVEDYGRHRSDREQARRRYLQCSQISPPSNLNFVSIESGRITPGHLVKVEAGQDMPADLVFLRSFHPRGHCFVETSNLDGETTLKVKSAVLPIHADGGLNFDQFELAVEDPNADLDGFKGELILSPNKEAGHSRLIQRVQLTSQNLLLRGTVLKNTEYIIGVVVYTGEQTKIRCSSSTLSKGIKGLKISTQSIIANKMMVRMFSLQIVLCTIAAIASQIWISTSLPKHWYLQISTRELHLEGTKRLFTYFILLSQMVPISFVVSIEMVKTVQALLIMGDNSFKNTVVKTSALTDELGQIGFVVSDKTGTLTENRMQLRQIICGSSLHTFGSGTSGIHVRLTANNECEPDANIKMRWTQILQAHISMRRRCSVSSGEDVDIDSKNVNTFDGREELVSAISNLDSDTSRMVMHCALSNTVTPIHDISPKGDKSITYQSSSPDELELCEFARSIGYELLSKNPETVVTLPSCLGTDKPVFKLTRLASLEFNSKRKRVTIVYRNVDSVMIMTKGADNIMLPLLSEPCPDDLPQHLALLAQRGLRTLVFAEGHQHSSWWDKWASIWEQTFQLPEDGEEQGHSRGSCSEKCRICDIAGQIERDAGLKFVGATGLEDSLQFLVPETVAQLRLAGIRLVMLTGDKPETAFSIALAASFIAKRTHTVTFLNESSDSFINTLNEAEQYLQHQPPSQFAMAIEGAALHALLEQDLQVIDRFLRLHAHPFCQALICARATPALKAAVVLHLRRYHKRKFGSILAVGDGANDEEMIIRADVGVGIAGLEGSAASRAADFSINSFRELHTLIFVHGVWNYDRIAKVSHFIFYKAAIIPIGMFCFGIVSAFSGTQLYPEGLNVLNSVFFTGLPIIVVGVLDRVLDRHHLEDFSAEIYRSVRMSALFNEWSFFRWFISSCFDGTIMFAFVFYVVDIGDFYGSSREASSAAAFTALFFTVTIRCLMLSSSITLLHIAACVISIVAYVILCFVLNRFPMSGIYGVFHHLLTKRACPFVLLTVIFTVAMSMLSYMTSVALEVFLQKNRLEEVRRVILSQSV